MKFQCDQCKSILNSDSVTDGIKVDCPVCGVEIVCHPYGDEHKLKLSKITADGDTDGVEENLSKVIQEKVASAVGIEKLEGFSLSGLFSEVFSKHSREEMENCFTVGTSKTTPNILDIDVSWPKPWMFTRMILASLVLYILLLVGWNIWKNPNLLPGLMLVGSFAIPISTLILFIELNVRRNISLYMVSRLVFLGGVFSLLITHLLPDITSVTSILFRDWRELMGASVAGPLEESAKVLAMVVVASAAKFRYKLNGLLVGAAVGTGFSAFESAGYAFSTLLADRNVDVMVQVINMRGLMSPFSHIVWSAIAGCALWRVINGQKFKWYMLCDERFIRLLLVPVVLHMVWNSPLQLPYFGTFIVVGFVGWFVCLSLVQEGLNELAGEQKDARKHEGEESVLSSKGEVQ